MNPAGIAGIPVIQCILHRYFPPGSNNFPSGLLKVISTEKY